jgi:hypothetical protein
MATSRIPAQSRLFHLPDEMKALLIGSISALEANW